MIPKNKIISRSLRSSLNIQLPIDTSKITLNPVDSSHNYARLIHVYHIRLVSMISFPFLVWKDCDVGHCYRII